MLPAQPVDVPHYAPAPGRGPVALVRSEGSVRFDPAVLDGAQQAAAHAPALGALQGLVAVPADMVIGDAVRVSIGGREVSLVPLWRPAESEVLVCGVYEPVPGTR